MLLFDFAEEMSCVSSISTIRTSPDWMSADPSQDINVDEHWTPAGQPSAVCKNTSKLFAN